jgi:membrane-associated phospholipid phosphatase
MSRSFFAFHALAITLIASLFLLPSHALWHVVDTACFVTLNSSIIDHPIQQAFWAVSNIKITDVFGGAFLLGCFLMYIFEEKGQERRKRVAHLLYTLIWFEISILLCKQCFTPICEHLGVSRHSPTVLIKEAVRLSTVIPWAKIKDSSYFCFPADHACIVFQWCSFLWFFTGWKRGLSAFLFSTLFLLPRLISGAHWLSDILVGSGSIVIIALAWALCTPLLNWWMNRLYRIVNYNPPLLTPGESNA